MPYATLQDLIERAGELEIKQVSDRDRDGTPDPDVIDAAIAGAQSMIDGYLGSRYGLPLPGVPDLVNTWAVSIARYHLHRNGAPDHVERDYKDAVSGLKDAARGIISLGLPTTASQPAPAQGQGSVMFSAPPLVFSPANLTGWKP